MDLRKWFADRGPRFVWQRGGRLLQRYGFVPRRATQRISSCLATLDEFDCVPTLPAPAVLLEKQPQFFRRLQGAGAEIAVHSYQHVQLSHLSAGKAVEQLEKAARVFARYGIEVLGFRCPYLSYTDELLSALPDGLFDYSSNMAIWWDHARTEGNGEATAYLGTLGSLYKGIRSREWVSVPWQRSTMIEIPVSLPDDIWLHDGLGLAPEGMAQTWLRMLGTIWRRGELFTLLFHTELATFCERPFVMLLREAKRLRPAVWVTRLRDVADWWKEKSRCRVEESESAGRLHVALECSARATILARGVELGKGTEPWDGVYRRVEGRMFDLPAAPRPFVGLERSSPERVASFLREQGYIVDTSEAATRCATYLDASLLARLKSQAELVDYIESAATPLIRFWRWPNGCKSALCLTGDLDALSLLDYASRLFVA